jgi:hypothetical protein
MGRPACGDLGWAERYCMDDRWAERDCLYNGCQFAA